MKGDDKKKEPTRWEKFVKEFLRGTVSEPWPTAEELFNDPKIQEKMKMMREMTLSKKKSKN